MGEFLQIFGKRQLGSFRDGPFDSSTNQKSPQIGPGIAAVRRENFPNIPGHLYTGKRHKLHETSPIRALNSAGHSVGGSCRLYYFWCKDTPGCAPFFALVCPRPFVHRRSTQANRSTFSVVSDFKRCFNKSRDCLHKPRRAAHIFFASKKSFPSFRPE